jgi:Protein of unknown function (DUF541)
MPSGNYVRAEGTAEFFVRPQIAVTGVKLTSEELEGKRSQMEQAALANAQMKAQNMAKVANKALGSILKVVYQSTDGKASDNALAPDASSNSTNSADMGRGSIHESGIAVVYYELVQDVPRLSGATDGVIVSKPRRR